MHYISKQQLLTLTLCFGVFLALSTVGAYTGPIAGPTGNNTPEPILENTISQDKPGNLAVNAFTARTASTFLQNTTFNAMVSGGTEGDRNSTLRFGDSSHTTNLSITGSLRTNKTFKSKSLAHSGPGLKPLCADADGNLFLCAGSTPVGPSCGNTIVESGEQCDDGNTTNGDGCSSSCQNESNPIAFNWLNVSVIADQDWYYPICDVGLNQAAPTDATISLRYTYTTAGEFPPIYHVRECYVGVPAGNTSYQQQESPMSGYLYPSQIENNLCYVSGTNNYPVNAPIPAC